VKKIGKRTWIIGAVLALALVGAWYWRSRAARQSGPAFRPVAVERGDLTLQVSATGTVQPENRLEIKPPIAGRVEQVLVQEGQRVRRGQVLAWMSSTERAALLDAARAKGPEEVKRWEELYRPTPILAPINGTLILRSVESGQTFTTSDAILVMSDRLTVKAQVDETDIARVKLRQPAQLVLDAYPDHPIPGAVDQIAFEAKTVNNVTTYTVDVLPRETPDFMRSGMTATVTFQVASKEGVLLVPSDAIRTEQGASYVLLPSAEGRPERRTVQTGLSDGPRTEIVSGLKEGEQVLQPQLANDAKASAGRNFLMPGRPGGGRRGR
jgi:macrolide-specific efflux system membrane fusion protein